MTKGRLEAFSDGVIAIIIAITILIIHLPEGSDKAVTHGRAAAGGLLPDQLHHGGHQQGEPPSSVAGDGQRQQQDSNVEDPSLCSG